MLTTRKKGALAAAVLGLVAAGGLFAVLRASAVGLAFTERAGRGEGGGVMTWFDGSSGESHVVASTETWDEEESRVWLELGFSFRGRTSKGAPASLTVTLGRENLGTSLWDDRSRFRLLAGGAALALREGRLHQRSTRAGVGESLSATIDTAEARRFVEAPDATVVMGASRFALSAESRRLLSGVLSPDREWSGGPP